MRHIVTFMARLAPPYLSTISHNRCDFRGEKKVAEHKICVLILFTNLSKTFLILRIIWRDIVINVKSLHVKYPLFLSALKETGIFSADFRKKAQMSSSNKIHTVGAELLRADRRTDGRT